MFADKHGEILLVHYDCETDDDDLSYASENGPDVETIGVGETEDYIVEVSLANDDAIDDAFLGGRASEHRRDVLPRVCQLLVRALHRGAGREQLLALIPKLGEDGGANVCRRCRGPPFPVLSLDKYCLESSPDIVASGL